MPATPFETAKLAQAAMDDLLSVRDDFDNLTDAELNELAKQLSTLSTTAGMALGAAVMARARKQPGGENL